jgi:1-acyl-sn-glycerol-3-phosphate acyltransferase
VRGLGSLAASEPLTPNPSPPSTGARGERDDLSFPKDLPDPCLLPSAFPAYNLTTRNLFSDFDEKKVALTSRGWHREKDDKPPDVFPVGWSAALVQRYFVEPYRFIPPYRSTLWCWVGKHILPRHMRRQIQVTHTHFQGAEHLQESLRQKAGILIAGNHCRSADPLVMGALSVHVRQFFYYVVSYHLFKMNRFNGWWINRVGGYSILREGADREAIRMTAGLLAKAERPVVLFPEGTWFRQNDRLGPLQEGVSLMARQACKQTDRPIVIHPVAIKYWVLEDPQPILRERLDRLETRLGWLPQRQLDFLPRLEKLAGVLIAIKESEMLGRPGSGSIDERLQKLTAGIVSQVERDFGPKEAEGAPLERIRRIRLRLVRQLAEVSKDPVKTEETRNLLDRLVLAENLNAHSMDYLVRRPSLERLVETIQRIEETVEDREPGPLVPTGAVVTVGPAIDVAPLLAQKTARHGPDPLIHRVAVEIQAMLDRMLDQGPPAEWNCPPRIEGNTALEQADASGNNPAPPVPAGSRD